MKILLDEMCGVWYDRLRLRRQNCNLPNDPAVTAYAPDNGMVLVTKDNICGRAGVTAGIRCMLPDDEEVCRLLFDEAVSSNVHLRE